MIQNKNAVLFTLGCVANDPQLLKIYKLNDNDFVEKWHKATYMGIQILADRGANEIFVDDLEEALKDSMGDETPAYLNFTKYDGATWFVNAKELSKGKSIEAYYWEVKKYSVLRELYDKGYDITHFFNDDEIDPDVVDKITENFRKATPESIIEYYKTQLDTIEITNSKKELSFVDVFDLPNANKEYEFLIDNFMIKNTFNSIVAPAKVGKSQFAYQLAYCVQNGIPFLGFNTHQADVLYADFELRENAIRKRYEAVNDYLQAENAQSYKVMSLSSAFADGKVTLDDVVEAARKAKENNPKFELIIFDCYYSFAEGDQNSENDVKKTLHKLKSLTDILTVVYVTHTNKNDLGGTSRAIYAAGGSGVHGKIVDETYIITEKKDGFIITSTGRDWTDKKITCIKNESTNWFFQVVEGIDEKEDDVRHKIAGKKVITNDTIKEDYPELYEAIGMDGINFSTLHKDFPKESVTTLKNKGFKYTGKNKREDGIKTNLILLPTNSLGI